jgi:hypothetical protein
MSTLEKILLGLIAGASTAAPIFVHSPQGILVLNASENLLAGILGEFGPKAPTA